MIGQNTLRIGLVVAAILPAYAQVRLTGAVWFASTPTGGTSVQQAYADGAVNTVGGDQWWNLWMALNPDASLPANGPADSQAAISISMLPGNTYTYYLFSQGPCCTLAFSGLNLYFNNNGSVPGISVFGAVDSAEFRPNANRSTFSLAVETAPGSGRGFFSAGGATVVLQDYEWRSSGTLDVCQAFTFVPGTAPSAVGSLTLQVFPAAVLHSGLPSASPGTETTLSGSGFVPGAQVALYFGHLGPKPAAIVRADQNGALALQMHVPPAPYGPSDIYAAGAISGSLGATSVFVTPRLLINPRTGVPGENVTIQGFGFGANEPVDVYWGNPRQPLGLAVTNARGSFAGSGASQIRIPVNAAPGANAIVVIGQTTKAIAVGDVIVK